MYLTEIKETTKQNIGNLCKKIRKNEKYLKFVNERTCFLDDDSNLALRLFYIRKNKTKKEECQECGKQLKINHLKFCSKRCSNIVSGRNTHSNEKRSKKIKLFWKNISPEDLKKITEKNKKTNFERYGHISNLHAGPGKDKKLETWKKNGYTNPNKSKKVRNKIKKTCNKRYGGDAPTSSKNVCKKRSENFKKKHGVENPMQLQSTIDKISKNYFEKTGYNWASQNPEVKEKQRNTWCKNDGLGKHKKGFKYKTFKINEKIFLCQGYEIQFLEKELLKKYDYKKIKNSVSEMKKFNFRYNEDSLYIPDFFIEEMSLFIEVKSEYWFLKQFETIMKKAKAVIDKDYLFYFAISKNGKYFKKIKYEEAQNYKEILQKRNNKST